MFSMIEVETILETFLRNDTPSLLLRVFSLKKTRMIFVDHLHF